MGRGERSIGDFEALKALSGSRSATHPGQASGKLTVRPAFVGHRLQLKLSQVFSGLLQLIGSREVLLLPVLRLSTWQGVAQ